MKLTFLLTLLQIVVLLPSIAPLKNLTEIHYRFTTCGSTGYEGPLLEACFQEYSNDNSPIVHPKNLLVDFGANYEGAQGFRVPKSGLYNITVAGAAGGRGICSIDSGKGLVWRGQVNLNKKDNLLILVGQKGVGPCDIQHDVDLPLCRNPPTSIDDINRCQIEWINWIRNHPDVIGLEMSGLVGDLNHAYIGGGGGGGASMVSMLQRQSGMDSDFDANQLVVTGGGGGSGSELNYDVQELRDFNLRLNPPSGPGSVVEGANSTELYFRLINAKVTTHKPQLSQSPGGRGYVNEAVVDENLRAGAGGGWFLVPGIGDTDGEPLSVQRNFAHGGFDCARQIAGRSTQAAVIEMVQGGFGGGGGQCGGGGAGGGYTGGSIIGIDIQLPGGGGYSFFSSDDMSEEMSTISSTGDGYVDLVPSNCGCTGYCEIVGELFHCLCPEDTFLAPDEFDCYFTQDLQVRESSLTSVFVDKTEINIRVLSFNRTVSLYSIDVQLTVLEENEPCLIILLDDDSDIIVSSNVVRDTERADMLSEVHVSPDGTVSLNYNDMLNTPVVVSQVLLVSSGNCSVQGTVLTANISLHNDSEGGLLNDARPYNESEVASLAQEIFLSGIPIPSAALSDGEIVGIAIGVLAAFGGALILIIVAIAVVYTKAKRRKHDGHEIDEIPMGTNNIPYHNGLVLSAGSSGLPDEIFIKSDQLKLGKIIGEGEFGSVYKAKMYLKSGEPPQVVAVKTLKGFFNQQHVEDLLSESKRMFLLNHPNVQTMIGVCLDGGPIPFVVMPYMQNGCLLSFLRKNKDTLLLVQAEEDEVKAATQRLTEMCLQIAKGMEYLASQNIVHRDLAARNCMIDDEHCICVSDFGLSESMYTKTYFRQDDFTSVRLPLKWLAPESFNTGIFSEKTDVWAFGVTCWEVFNGGRIPYPGITAQSLPKLINRGQRMDKPDNLACIDAMYNDVMKKCWLPKPEDRPTFTSLVGTIGSELEMMSEYLPLMSTSNFGHNDIFVEEEPVEEIPRAQNLYL